MLRTRIFATVQAICAVLAFGSSFMGTVYDPPVVAGQPIWSMYRLVQVIGFVGAVLLWCRLRHGAVLSVLFWGVQLCGVQGQTFRFAVGTAFTLFLTYSVAPGTVEEMNPPSYVVLLNLVPIVALSLLTWVLKPTCPLKTGPV